MTLPEPVFFHTDAEQIKSECIAYYEELTGTKLSPGQAEMFIINVLAYRELLYRVSGNEAGKQELLSFARYPMLDYLGELVGVTRLPASKATCTIQFNLVNGHGSLVIPEGIRVSSTDGKVVFITLQERTVLSSTAYVTVLAEATTEGSAGNGYEAGKVSIILDPQAFVASAANTGTTAGGSDQEGDEELRDRIRLAPSAFSCAGPRGAYEYFAKSAHPSIIDVGITSPVPGQVNVYPLIENAATPSQEIIDAVNAKLNDEKVRPLTDTVVVDAPEKIEYEIEVNLTLLTDAIASTTQEQVLKNLQAYADERKKRLGVDAKRAQINARSCIDQVYDVDIVSPASDVEVDFNQVAYCTGISVNIAGFSNE